MPSMQSENLEHFLQDLRSLVEPQGEGWYALVLSSLHDRFHRLSDFAKGVIRQEVSQEQYRRVIAFAA